jgi:hypothetical protein
MKRILSIAIISILMLMVVIFETLPGMFYSIPSSSLLAEILIPSIFGSFVIIGAIGIFMMKKWGYAIFITMMILSIIGLVVNMIINHSGCDTCIFISGFVFFVELIVTLVFIVFI